jgi:hypothetical protein
MRISLCLLIMGYVAVLSPSRMKRA